MNKKIFFTLLLLAAGLRLAAQEPAYCPTEDLCYQLNATTKTATLCGGYPTGGVVIPATVQKDAVDYTVTAIRDNVFKDYTGITSVTIPATVNSIGKSAFAASSVTSTIVEVNFADTCKTTLVVDTNAFWRCKMTSVTLPVNTKQINQQAFAECHEMQSLTIPNTVDSIESQAFRLCDGLKHVYVSWPASQVAGLKVKTDIFEGVSRPTIPLHVPKGTASTYKTVEPWKYFLIKEDTAVVTATPTANNRIYDGTMQDLVTAGAVTGGTMHYSTDNATWSATIPQAKNAGSYTVYYKAVGDAYHADSIPSPNTVPVTINKKDLTIKADDQTITYGDPLYKKATYTGFVAGEDAGVLSHQVDFDCDYVVGSPVGDYPITPKNAAAANYEITYQSGTITVVPDEFDIHAHPDPDKPTEFYSTFYHGTNNYAMPDGIDAEAYVAALINNALYLTKVADGTAILPAGHAVILKANTAEFKLTRSLDAPIEITATNNLEGSDVVIPTPSNCYVLSDHTEAEPSVKKLGFYQYLPANLNAHKAYVIISTGSSSAPKRLPFVYGTPTDIENQKLQITNHKFLKDGRLIIIREGVQYNAYGQKIQ